jgi:hypothetical protein
MPLSEGQKTAILKANEEANGMINRLLYAVNRPRTAIQDLEELDPTETDADAIGMVNRSKDVAITVCDELKTYLEGLPDLT